MDESVNLVVFPGVQEGHDEAVVKKKLARVLSVDLERVEAWFLKEKPTTILKDIDAAVAERYVTAIMKCGGQCNTHPVGKEHLSLVPKSANIDTTLFVCPSCEHDEDIPRNTEIEQCPKCGLVIATWEEQMRDEAEQEKIRRRLLREAQTGGDKAERERKRKELEALKVRQRVLMEELEMKVPGALWVLYEKHPVSMSGIIGSVIILLTATVYYFADQYFEQHKMEELIAASPDNKIQEVAPFLGAVVQLRQNGSAQVVTEIADATAAMRGQTRAAREEMVKAAQQMMKGAEPEKFVESAMVRRLPGKVARLSAGETEATAVNIDTLGGVSGLRGVQHFEFTTLNQLAPQLLLDGNEKLLQVFIEKKMKTDVVNPELHIIVEALDEMDGSMIVNLMDSLSFDQEWDQFLAAQVSKSLSNQDYEKASGLSNRIGNPVARIGALSEMMGAYLLDGEEGEVKLLKARLRLELDKIEDLDLKAKMLISVGESLGAMGSKKEPKASLARVETIAAEGSSPYDRTLLHARLAVAYMQQGDRAKSRQQFGQATRFAAQVKEPADRISVFTRVAMRYFDARNTTLAHEILSESEILAATQLEPVERARVFGEIAMARGYLGDLSGARLAINNAAHGEGRDQLLARLSKMLIELDRYYQALSVMDSIEGDVESVRLEVRLISSFIYSNRQTEARQRLPGAISRAERIKAPGERGLLLSQLARLTGRLGDLEGSQILFTRVLVLSDLLQGRKADVTRGMVALSQARIFQLGESQEILAGIKEIVVKDPLASEIVETKRTVSLLLKEPAAVTIED